MRVLYKYMPFRLSFFDDPLLRLTSPSDLNDPFDSKPTQAGIDKKIKFFFDEQGGGETGAVDSENIRSTYERGLRDGLDKFGIISLTEDPYNLLMWSHYAAEHRGLVVSIACDSSTFEYHDKFTEKCGVSKLKPARVRYSNMRPGFQMPDNAIYEYFENNFYTHFAMTKGNDWIYEKEYRYLLRLAEGDVAVVDVCNESWVHSQGPDVFITHLHSNTYKVEMSSVEKRELLTWVLAFAQGRKQISNVMFFKRLTKGSVTGVYFGSRVVEENILAARKVSEINPLFGQSVSFYKSVISQDRFEINFERLE
ncbi:DUF2971 domain-containing protein [Pseudomonas savastanoi pv. phaseolicola]|uniref:DUF2971 domain-containing protein n=1 Tax=Pseudomonas savastanoi TaxID=29438 RepID=UPI000578B1F4|nr:DUF2971 domain-containing protein [Pseudomonas savastanoi]MBN3469693.1 DUF2971 domain-containing protein [Pseudomonas savastanoi pv. phaseolicola]MBN3476755.1 DUF2971 domain-containing protein [Pseudomonas savastanoi pv. phaseolicola]